MSAPSPREDLLFNDIVAWAKAAALAEGKEQLEPHHLLLGALRVEGGNELVCRFLQTVGPLDPDEMDEAFRKPLERMSGPVNDRKMGLSPELARITSAVYGRRGRLTADAVLEQVVSELLSDPEWGHLLSKEAAKHPRPSPARVDRVAAALERVSALRVALRSEVLGQDQAVDQVCDAFLPVFLEAGQAATARTVRPGPRAILTFAGPPGVGKTLLAETLARALGDGDVPVPLLRLDMSAYAGHQAHEQLVGFSRAYSGAQRGILAGFVEENPEGMVLVDEIEKAHPNTQRLFLQVLDAGRLYDNHGRRDVDFSRVVVVFTTNLGRELYDAPNTAGVLYEARDLTRTLLEALAREGRPGEDGGGLPAPLVSRLAKGAVVLFQRLGGRALERVTDLTFRRVSEELQDRTGLGLAVKDPRILMLFILRFAPGGDARRLTSGLRRFLFATVGDVLGGNRARLVDGDPPLLRDAAGFRFELGGDDPLPAAIRTALERENRVLVIDDDEWAGQVPGGLRLQQVTDRDGADRVLRGGGADFVLLDLHIGAPRSSPDRERGLELLRWLRRRYPGVPVYLFSEFPEKRGLGPELLERVSAEGGARGVLSKRFQGFDERDLLDDGGFFDQLAEIDAALRRQRLVDHYQRRAKVVDFDVNLRMGPPAPDGHLVLEVRRVRELTAVSALDLGGRGWVSLPRERFEDVAGAERAKERLQEVVAWLKDATPLRRLGLEAPKGILLTGPPGTGKTTLARAVAGEAEAPFFAVSGSEVFSKWVGQSEANVRELFACARRYAPSVVFIDEVDSLGRARDGAEGGSWTSTVLNELLAQMDGFRQGDQPVFVLAATNRPDVLDPALLRPGRFDLQIEVPLPNTRARRALLRLYTRSLPVAGGVDIERLVRRSAGLSGADLRQACTEAGLIALRRGETEIGMAALEEGITVVRMGLADEAATPDEPARRATAVHEAGHAVAQHHLFPEREVVQVSILPRGRTLGFAEWAGGDETGSPTTRDGVLRQIQVALAGRAAEELVLGPGAVGAGCQADLRTATALAVRAVGQWGLDPSFGPVSLEGFRRASPGGEVPAELEKGLAEKVRQWLGDAQRAVGALLEARRADVDALAAALLAEETLYGDRVRNILGERGDPVSPPPGDGRPTH